MDKCRIMQTKLYINCSFMARKLLVKFMELLLLKTPNEHRVEKLTFNKISRHSHFLQKVNKVNADDLG